ncbi:putative MFS transporter [Xylariaceae sp. FL0662B]|nr:putative MFS transporter [Xylariaceae sp. FL0662B]
MSATVEGSRDTKEPLSTAFTDENNRMEKDIHAVAEEGYVATTSQGESIVQFDKAAERRLRVKIDWMIVPTVSLLYLFCFIDRANIGNARLAGLERDLGMRGNDYNVLLSVFYISYILFEIPANLCCKWMGPGWFIPATSLGFGVVSLGTAFVQDLPAACGVRFLLGVFEAGMMPGIAYYLSRWYRRSELAFRLSLYIVMAPLAGAFGGLLASGILSLPHIGSLHEWRMIFIVEGIITIGLSLISVLSLTDRPETAVWLTEEEKALAVARVKSERVAQTRLLDEVNRKKIWRALSNPVILATSVVFLFNNITVQGLAFFAPTIVATIYPTYTTVQKQLYTVPPYVVGSVFEILLPLLSWRFDKRQIFMMITAPLTMMGYIMFLASHDARVRYAATFFTAASCFALGPLTNAQVSAQTASDSARSVAIALNVMFGNIGGLVATWSYLQWDAPHYRIGNGLNLAASGLILVLTSLILAWMLADNRRRDRKKDGHKPLSGLSSMELESLEWKHPAFRWKP